MALMGIGGGLAVYLCLGGMRAPPPPVERASHVEMGGANIEEGGEGPFSKGVATEISSRSPLGKSKKGSTDARAAGKSGRVKRNLQTGSLLSAEEAAHGSSAPEHYVEEDTPTVIDDQRLEDGDVFGGPVGVALHSNPEAGSYVARRG